MTPADERAALIAAFRDACTHVDLAGRVAAALAPSSGGRPRIVVAAGKCAGGMLAGALDADCVRALAVVPHGSADLVPRDPRVEVIEAAHPLPDEGSVRAAEAALALAADGSDAERVFLVSGGASSLLCAPVAGITLDKMRAIGRALLAADASIRELNTVRRHLSRIKGGGLARACGAHARRTLIVSDVVGATGEDAAKDVGSGPSVADSTTRADAIRIAARFGFHAAHLPWVETWKTPERCEIIAGPKLFAELVRDALVRAGIAAALAATAPTQPMHALADDYARAAATLAPGAALVRIAEPTLRVEASAGHVRGGRAGHLAAMMSLRLPPGVVFASIATDGVDGTSGTGGAIVHALRATDLDARTRARTEAAIAAFDTGPLHIAGGTALVEGPTGLNFADVHILWHIL